MRLLGFRRRLAIACQRIFFAPLFFCSLRRGIVLGKVFAFYGFSCREIVATDPAFVRAVAFRLALALFVLASLVSGLVFRFVSGPVW